MELKRETNREHYKEKILDVVCGDAEKFDISFAFNKNDGKISSCSNTKCSDCLFCNDKGCISEKQKWSKQEYNPFVDWSKVPVDTKILVSDDGKMWRKRYFAKYENDRVYAFFEGTTSWSNDIINDGYTIWLYAKLADDVEMD